jgi:hypothetical protein
MAVAPDTTRDAVPRGSVNIRLSADEEDLVDRLVRLLGASGPSDMTRRCWRHALATIELGQPVHATIPSEVEREKRDRDRREREKPPEPS